MLAFYLTYILETFWRCEILCLIQASICLFLGIALVYGFKTFDSLLTAPPLSTPSSLLFSVNLNTMSKKMHLWKWELLNVSQDVRNHGRQNLSPHNCRLCFFVQCPTIKKHGWFSIRSVGFQSSLLQHGTSMTLEPLQQIGSVADVTRPGGRSLSLGVKTWANLPTDPLRTHPGYFCDETSCFHMDFLSGYDDHRSLCRENIIHLCCCQQTFLVSGSTFERICLNRNQKCLIVSSGHLQHCFENVHFYFFCNFWSTTWVLPDQVRIWKIRDTTNQEMFEFLEPRDQGKSG